jgi:hypothetical protein
MRFRGNVISRTGAGALLLRDRPGGGVASVAEDHSSFNKVAGLGFGGSLTESALENIERAFAPRA